MALRISRFLQLDSGRRRMFLRAWFLLGRVRIELHSKPFRQLVTGLSSNDPETVEIPAARMKEARDIGWAIRAAARHTPWESACLVQVLAAQRMLAASGIPGAFYLGAATGEDDDNTMSLSAHAWLKCGPEFITGEPGHERFAVLSCFSWR